MPASTNRCILKAPCAHLIIPHCFSPLCPEVHSSWPRKPHQACHQQTLEKAERPSYTAEHAQGQTARSRLPSRYKEDVCAHATVYVVKRLCLAPIGSCRSILQCTSSISKHVLTTCLCNAFLKSCCSLGSLLLPAALNYGQLFLEPRCLIYIYIYTYIYLYILIYTYIYLYILIYTYIYLYILIYTYIYLYILIYT